MERHDYAYPFRIAPSSRQGAQTDYPTHVDQLIRQVLLTAPGERADLPGFGCGIRQLLFAPHSDALDATTQLLVQQALNKWLSGQIQVQKVTVTTPDTGDTAEFLIVIEYLLIETQMNRQVQVAVL
jgi:phage baseplate assembly protein W